MFHVQSQVVDIHLTLWHGFNQVLLLSIFTVAMGLVVFWLRRPVGKLVGTIISWTDQYHLPERFNKLISNYLGFAGKHTNHIQHGYHRFYLITFFIATLLLITYHLLSAGGKWFYPEESSPVRMHVVLVLIVSAMAVLFAVFSKSRLSAILSMGVLGYGVAVLYMFYGAVDLAITQFLAETVLMVIFVMVIYHLPRFAVLSNKKSRIRDALIALAVGAMMTMIVLKARFISLKDPISDFFTEKSLLEGYGRNIVNVILVDFRALDTLGEITVLALAAAGVFTLLRFNSQKKDTEK